MPVEFGIWRIDGHLTRVPAVLIDLESRIEDILDQEIPGVNIGAVFFKVSNSTMNASTRLDLVERAGVLGHDGRRKHVSLALGFISEGRLER